MNVFPPTASTSLLSLSFPLMVKMLKAGSMPSISRTVSKPSFSGMTMSAITARGALLAVEPHPFLPVGGLEDLVAL